MQVDASQRLHKRNYKLSSCLTYTDTEQVLNAKEKIYRNACAVIDDGVSDHPDRIRFQHVLC